MEDAGYAEGFRTTYELVPDYIGDVDLAQILQGYWEEINVTVDIEITESGAYVGNYSSKGYGGLFATPSRGTDYDPLSYVRTMGYSGSMWNGPGASDAVFDALVDNAEAATDLEEMMRYVTEADLHWIEQHYDICLLRVPGFTFWQPWLKGYNGEISLGAGMESTIFSRVWIDRELKAEMGH